MKMCPVEAVSDAVLTATTGGRRSGRETKRCGAAGTNGAAFAPGASRAPAASATAPARNPRLERTGSGRTGRFNHAESLAEALERRVLEHQPPLIAVLEAHSDDTTGLDA